MWINDDRRSWIRCPACCTAKKVSHSITYHDSTLSDKRHCKRQPPCISSPIAPFPDDISVYLLLTLLSLLHPSLPQHRRLQDGLQLLPGGVRGLRPPVRPAGRAVPQVHDALPGPAGASLKASTVKSTGHLFYHRPRLRKDSNRFGLPPPHTRIPVLVYLFLSLITVTARSLPPRQPLTALF